MSSDFWEGGKGRLKTLKVQEVAGTRGRVHPPLWIRPLGVRVRLIPKAVL